MIIPEGLMRLTDGWKVLIHVGTNNERELYIRRGVRSKTPCLYILRSDTGHFYVGSTADASGRLATHARTCLNGAGANTMLQELFNKGHIFDFLIIYTETREDAYEFEQLTVDLNWGDPLLLNQGKDVRKPMRGRILTQENIDKLQASQKTEAWIRKNQTWTSSPEYSQKARIQFSRSTIVEGVTYASATDAGITLGVPKTTVLHRIKSDNPKFKNWNWA